LRLGLDDIQASQQDARCDPRVVTALAHARACPSPRRHFRAGAVASNCAGGDRG
jgi:hypothetical protein